MRDKTLKRLPDGWMMVPLEELIESAQPGFACGLRDSNGVIQLRMNNVDTRGNFVWDNVLRVPIDYTDISQFELKEGDVLFNNTNSTELVGKSALYKGYRETVVYSNHFTRLRGKTDKLLPDLLSAWLNYQWFQGVFANICNRWIGQSAVKADKLMKLLFPLPPFPEQQRIAAILREQMAAVEKARKAAQERIDIIDALPAALLRRAFNGEL
jgi:type I restriction enzyme S subunit